MKLNYEYALVALSLFLFLSLSLAIDGSGIPQPIYLVNEDPRKTWKESLHFQKMEVSPPYPPMDTDYFTDIKNLWKIDKDEKNEKEENYEKKLQKDLGRWSKICIFLSGSIGDITRQITKPELDFCYSRVRNLFNGIPRTYLLSILTAKQHWQPKRMNDKDLQYVVYFIRYNWPVGNYYNLLWKLREDYKKKMLGTMNEQNIAALRKIAKIRWEVWKFFIEQDESNTFRVYSAIPYIASLSDKQVNFYVHYPLWHKQKWEEKNRNNSKNPYYGCSYDSLIPFASYSESQGLSPDQMFQIFDILCLNHFYDKWPNDILTDFLNWTINTRMIFENMLKILKNRYGQDTFKNLYYTSSKYQYESENNLKNHFEKFHSKISSKLKHITSYNYDQPQEGKNIVSLNELKYCTEICLEDEDCLTDALQTLSNFKGISKMSVETFYNILEENGFSNKGELFMVMSTIYIVPGKISNEENTYKELIAKLMQLVGSAEYPGSKNVLKSKSLDISEISWSCQRKRMTLRDMLDYINATKPSTLQMLKDNLKNAGYWYIVKILNEYRGVGLKEED